MKQTTTYTLLKRTRHGNSFSSYIRYCRRCGTKYKTPIKGSRICPGCDTRNGGVESRKRQEKVAEASNILSCKLKRQNTYKEQLPVLCENCGTTFYATRPNHLTCSLRCRVSLSRKRRRE